MWFQLVKTRGRLGPRIASSKAQQFPLSDAGPDQSADCRICVPTETLDRIAFVGSTLGARRRERRGPDRTHTSQIVTPCLSDASTSGRAGTNSCATWPLKPVSTMAFMTAG